MGTFKDTLLLEDKVSKTLQKISGKTQALNAKTEKLRAKINSLGKNFSELGTKLKNTGSRMRDFGGRVSAAVTKIVLAVTAISASLVFALNKSADYADRVDKMSQKIGMSAEKYQELNFVLSQNGMNVDNLQMAYKTLTNKMVSAQKGSKDAIKIFSDLNVSIKDTNGQFRSTDDVFDDLIKKLTSMKNPTERMALAIQLFGRNAQELAPLLNGGLESYEKLKKVAREKGMILSNEEIQNAVKYKDTMDKFSRMFEKRMASLAINYMPKVTEYLDKIMARTDLWDKVINGLIKVIDIVVKLIDWFSNLSKGGKIAIGVFVGLAVTIGPLIYLIGSLITTIGAISSVTAIVAGVVAGAAGTFLLWTGIIAGLAAGIWAAVKAVQTLVGWIKHLNRMKINDLNTNFNTEQYQKLSKIQASMGEKAFAKKYGNEVSKAVSNYRENNINTNNNNSVNNSNNTTVNNYNSMLPLSQMQYAF